MNEKSYTSWQTMGDNTLLETIGSFIKHHRVNQNKTQNNTAMEAGISRSTLSLLECGQKVSLNTLVKVLRTLNLLFVMDIFEISDEISPIAYAKQKKNKRQRASTLK
jgi:transcriptional regulator with XRE-family HTH domain